MLSRNELWRNFYNLEKDFYLHLQNELTLINTISSFNAEYSTQTSITGEDIAVPPKQVRQIYKTSLEGFNEALGFWSEVKAAFVSAMEKDKKEAYKFPSRFPIFLNNVESINLSSHSAYSSVRIKDLEKELIICRYINSNFKQDLLKDIAILNDVGIEFNIQKDILIEKGIVYDYITMKQSTIKLYFSNIENIQYRRLSGTQYRARIHFKGQKNSTGIRYRAGLIICDGEPMIKSYNKSKNIRKHKTELIQLPLRFSSSNLIGEYGFLFSVK